jgi:acyl carrier protein
LNVAAVRESLRRQLPEYMVPSAFVRLDRLPLNSNGKVDRKALPKPSAERPETGAGYVAPRGRLEQSIANIWQELLRVEHVGVDDNFFDLGGHSLLMVQAHSRLRETFGKEIAMVELFRHPTVRALARFLEGDGAQQPSFAKSQQRAGRRREALRRQTQTTKERKKAND